MKILTVSDRVEPKFYEESFINQYSDIDLILSCGDLPPEYLTHLTSSLKVPLYYVCGNHDLRYINKTPKGCINLHQRLIKFNHINILGLEGCQWYNGGPYQYTEQQMKQLIRRLKWTIWWHGGINIIITHASPRNIHDAEDPCHRGFESYRQLIHRYSPAYFIHGHIHAHFNNDSERIATLNDTQIINSYGHHVFDLDNEKLLSKMEKAMKKKTNTDGLKVFKDTQKHEQAYNSENPEIREVPVHKIVGSVGRYLDFDSQFRLLRDHTSERFATIKELMEKGRTLDPIDLYQIKDEYYVLDGNHRVSAAKELNFDSLKAHIVKFMPSKKSLQNILYYEKNEFMSKTGLPDSIELTIEGQYAYLIKQISDHWHYLGKNRSGFISFEEAARDWYDSVYLPLIEFLNDNNILDPFPNRTISDLYLYITYHQWETGHKRKYGIEIDAHLPKSMEHFRNKMINEDEPEFPDIQQQGVVAFIFINVKSGKDYKIMERLYSIKEVKEVHIVSGHIDLIAKIVLKRNLLSSDSEIIGQFMHDNIRKISGVIKTQTIIPTSSKVKN